MPQLHVNVPEATAEALARHANARGLSLPDYLTELLTLEAAEDWPPGYFAGLGWEGELERELQPIPETREQ